SRVIRRTYLDSFDWRLFARGLVLECQQPQTGPMSSAIVSGRPGACECSLFELRTLGEARTIARRAIVAQPLAAPLSAREAVVSLNGLRDPRALPALLPDAAVQALGGRGLHVLGSSVERVLDFRAGDADAGMSPHVQLRGPARRRAKRPDATSEALVLRLCPLPGHDAELAALRDQLRQATAFGPESPDPALRGRIAGRAPGEVLDWSVPGLADAQRADHACRMICAHYASILEELLPFLDCGDIEFLHDYRIGVRRLRSILPHMHAVFPKRLLETSAALLAELAELTGPARDADVQVADARALLSEAGAEAVRTERELVLTRFIEDGEREQRRAHETLRGFLRSAAFRRRWRAFREGLAVPPGADELATRSSRRRARGLAPRAALKPAHMAVEGIGSLFERAVEQGHRIKRRSKPKRLHDLRKTLKRLRYTLDAFLPLCPRRLKNPVRKSLKSLQDLLGRFQDAEVQDLLLQELQRSIATEASPTCSTERALSYIRDWRCRLDEEQNQARRALEQRFNKFVRRARAARFPARLIK
ncbi:MAG: CHAD domain-containing protein, partial [Gammaproteobacteria bacterium]|nr:CHAD domain-containing protein [Gammaproteobacteria bacterium]